MPKKQVVVSTDALLGAKLLEAITGLQAHDNEDIEMYVEHLDRISGVLFELGGKMGAAESKNDIFEMLHINHLLRKDLEALRADS